MYRPGVLSEIFHMDLLATATGVFLPTMRTVLGALIKEGAYDGIDPQTVETGIMAMLFGLWLSAHLNPAPDHYSHSMRVLHVYLASVFPRHFEQRLYASTESR